MGWYRDRVFPRLVDKACNTGLNRRTRTKVCAELSGEVLEIGFGTGLNLPHLPSTVTRLLAVDPMSRGPELAAQRLAATDIPVEFVGLDAGRLALGDNSVDNALATWTLCSVDDPVEAVREIARVLRPGGQFRFVEHGVAPDLKVERWQNRLNPVQRVVACGCNINRSIPELIEAGGMTITELDTYYAKGEPKILGWTYCGIAAAA